MKAAMLSRLETPTRGQTVRNTNVYLRQEASAQESRQKSIFHLDKLYLAVSYTCTDANVNVRITLSSANHNIPTRDTSRPAAGSFAAT